MLPMAPGVKSSGSFYSTFHFGFRFSPFNGTDRIVNLIGSVTSSCVISSKYGAFHLLGPGGVKLEHLDGSQNQGS